MTLPQRQRTEKKAGISNEPLRSPERAPNPARPSKVALMIETSNAYSRGVLAGVKDFLRNSGAWNAHLTEHSRGERPPKWMTEWDGDGILARVESKQIARALADLRVPVVDLSSH